MPASQPFIRAVRKALRQAAVPADAGPMQAYMKSEMPFWGVKKPARATLAKAVIAEHPLADYSTWHDTVQTLYLEAGRREERYCALDLISHRSYRAHRRSWESFELYETLIVAGAWWDLVDELAAHHLGVLFEVEPKALSKHMRAWTRSDDLWRRRSAIICQLRRRADTDTRLLTTAIDAAIDSKEFFLRKAIGWALRQHGDTDPDWVRAFVAAREDRLSGLSKREALRKLPP